MAPAVAIFALAYEQKDERREYHARKAKQRRTDDGHDGAAIDQQECETARRDQDAGPHDQAMFAHGCGDCSSAPRLQLACTRWRRVDDRRPAAGEGGWATRDASSARLKDWRSPAVGIARAGPSERIGPRQQGDTIVVALVALILILAIFGGLGFAAHVLWILLAIAVVLWLLGFFVGGVEGGRRRWYGRW
jgi:hypothetical protein